MSVHDEIEAYIAGLPPAKGEQLRRLHERFTTIAPAARLWFLDGRDADGKVVSNPNIGYGAQAITYAGGGRRDFYKLGLSANATGLSAYVMGLEDRTWLARTYGPRLGKAKVTGYCIRFRAIDDIDLAVLEELAAEALAAKG